MSEQSEQIKMRCRRFSVNVLQLIDGFDRKPSLDVVARQLARSATSTGANYRASCTARSRAEYLSKLQTSSEEADESVHWFEILTDLGTVRSASLEPLAREATELMKIIGKSLGTARTNTYGSRTQSIHRKDTGAARQLK